MNDWNHLIVFKHLKGSQRRYVYQVQAQSQEVKEQGKSGLKWPSGLDFREQGEQQVVKPSPEAEVICNRVID